MDVLHDTPAPDKRAAVCLWCGTSLPDRKGPGSERKFCKPEHRAEFHTAARLWTERAVADGRLSVLALRRLSAPPDENTPSQALTLAWAGSGASRAPVRRPSSRPATVVEVGPDRRRVRITALIAREAIRILCERGADGCTALDFPHGRRVSAAVHKLRHEYGIPISTTDEVHLSVIEGRKAAGQHARYRCAVEVRLVNDEAAAAERRAAA